MPLNYPMAAKWFRKAADQGHAQSQQSLAVMYGKGQGVPRDFVVSYAWLILASEQGDRQAQSAKAEIEKLMTPAILSTAQKLARELRQ